MLLFCGINIVSINTEYTQNTVALKGGEGFEASIVFYQILNKTQNFSKQKRGKTC